MKELIIKWTLLGDFKTEWNEASAWKRIKFIINNAIFLAFSGGCIYFIIQFTNSTKAGESDYFLSTVALLFYMGMSWMMYFTLKGQVDKKP